MAHTPPLSPSHRPARPRSAPPLASVLPSVDTAATPSSHALPCLYRPAAPPRPFHAPVSAAPPHRRWPSSHALLRPSHPASTPASVSIRLPLPHPSHGRVPLPRPYSRPPSHLHPSLLHDCAAHPCPVLTSPPHRLPAPAPVWRCSVSPPHPYPLRITSTVQE
jgi:hypothetical protein